MATFEGGEETNTPGARGYLLAYVLADVVYVSVLLAPGVLGTPDRGGFGLSPYEVYVYSLLWVGVCGLPIGAVLIPIVHWFCKDVVAQAPHVLAAGLAGVVGIWVATTWMFPVDLEDAGWY